MKATQIELLNKGAAVVEAAQDYEIAVAAQDGTDARYLAHLLSEIRMMKWAIERDRPDYAQQFKENEVRHA